MHNLYEAEVLSEMKNGRTVKRTKSCPKFVSKQTRTKKLSLLPSDVLNMKRVRSCEDVRALSDADCTPAPPVQPLGDFTDLPIEVIYTVLEYLPVVCVSRLALCSKSFRDVLIEWINTVRPHNRLIPHFRRYAQVQWILPCLGDPQPSAPSPPFPADFRLDCYRIGDLLKRLTYLFPTHRRLDLFKRFTDCMEKLAQKKVAGISTEHLTRAASGIILHSLIAGWDHNECVKVYLNLSRFYNLPIALDRFFEHPGGNTWQTERFLRIHLRTLFLDFCAKNDRSIWLSIVFDPVKRIPSQMAQLLFLLYAPINQQGKIDWNFIDDEVSIHSYSYEIMAGTLTRLPIPSNELFASLMETPKVWQYRARAALFIYFDTRSSKLISEYFQQLSRNHDTPSAIWILVEIIDISRAMRHLCSTRTCASVPDASYVTVNATAALNIFRLALNSGWSQAERAVIVDETWRIIEQIAGTLFEDYLVTGNGDQLHLFLDTMKDISVRLSY